MKTSTIASHIHPLKTNFKDDREGDHDDENDDGGEGDAQRAQGSRWSHHHGSTAAAGAARRLAGRAGGGRGGSRGARRVGSPFDSSPRWAAGRPGARLGQQQGVAWRGDTASSVRCGVRQPLFPHTESLLLFVTSSRSCLRRVHLTPLESVTPHSAPATCHGDTATPPRDKVPSLTRNHVTRSAQPRVTWSLSDFAAGRHRIVVALAPPGRALCARVPCSLG